jgi:hypothetical protein
VCRHKYVFCFLGKAAGWVVLGLGLGLGLQSFSAFVAYAKSQRESVVLDDVVIRIRLY